MSKSFSYVFAYGSLMDKKSYKNTVGSEHYTSPIVRAYSLRRDVMSTGRNNPRLSKFWVVDMEDHKVFGQLAPVFNPLYFNLSVVRGSETVGPAILVTDENLEKIRNREGGYDMIDITDLCETVQGNLIEGYPIYTFVAKPYAAIIGAYEESLMPEPYLDLCRNAAKELGSAVIDNFNSHVTELSIPVMSGIKLGDNNKY